MDELCARIFWHTAASTTAYEAVHMNWIKSAINPKHKGLLKKQLGVPKGQTIPAKTLAMAAQAGGKEGQRARLAETLKGMGRHAKQETQPVKTDRGDFRMKG